MTTTKKCTVTSKAPVRESYPQIRETLHHSIIVNRIWVIKVVRCMEGTSSSQLYNFDDLDAA